MKTKTTLNNTLKKLIVSGVFYLKNILKSNMKWLYCVYVLLLITQTVKNEFFEAF